MEPELIVVQYGRGYWTCGQKFVLIRTVCLRARTLISCSVTATKTGQAPTESHVWYSSPQSSLAIVLSHEANEFFAMFAQWYFTSYTEPSS